MQVNQNRTEQRIEERERKKSGEQLRAKHIHVRVSRNDQKPAPFRRQPPFISLVSAFKNRHDRSPSPSSLSLWERVRVRGYETTRTDLSNGSSANSLTPALSRGEREFSSTVLHRLQKDVFERIAFERQPSNLHLRGGREPVKIAHLSSLLQDHFQTMLARNCALAAHCADRHREGLLIAARFQHQEFLVRFSLFFEVAVNDQPAFF